MREGLDARRTGLRRLTLRVGALLDRVFTHGLEPGLRTELLVERLDDRRSELAERSLMAVWARMLKSAPADLLWRITDRSNVTLIPAAVAHLAIGAGATVLGSRFLSVLQTVSFSLILLGLATVGVEGIRRPRALSRRGIAAGAIMLAAGSLLNAVSIPVVYGTLLADALTTLGLVVIGLGELAVAVGLIGVHRRILNRGGVALMVGIGLLAAGELIWAADVVTVEPINALGAVAIAIGCLIGINSLGRLRDVPIEGEVAVVSMEADGLPASDA